MEMLEGEIEDLIAQLHGGAIDEEAFAAMQPEDVETVRELLGPRSDFEVDEEWAPEARHVRRGRRAGAGAGSDGGARGGDLAPGVGDRDRQAAPAGTRALPRGPGRLASPRPAEEVGARRRGRAASSPGLISEQVRSDRQPQPMHDVRRPRIASSSSMRSSSSRATAAREPLPVALRRCAAGGERVERGADPLERDARGLAGLDQRDAPQRGAVVAALVAVRPPRGDQALALVEAERGRGDAAALRELADRQVRSHLT